MNIKWALIGMVLIAAIPVGMANSQTMVPDWIKQSMGLYSEGLITDADFISSMQYLIGQGIINVSDDTPDHTPDTSDYDDLLERQNIMIDIMLEKERIEIHNEIIDVEVVTLDDEWDVYYIEYRANIKELSDRIRGGSSTQQYDFYFNQHVNMSATYDIKRLQYLEDRNNILSQYLRCGSCLDMLERLAGVIVDPDV